MATRQYGGQPYGNSFCGLLTDVGSVSMPDEEAPYESWYIPRQPAGSKTAKTSQIQVADSQSCGELQEIRRSQPKFAFNLSR
jgi:hypothetical protein